MSYAATEFVVGKAGEGGLGGESTWYDGDSGVAADQLTLDP